MKHGRRRHVVLLCTDQTKNSPPKQAKVLLIMGSIFGWPKSALLCYTTWLTPESSLWAKQQFPRGSCQAELTVISGADVWAREGYQRPHHWKQREVIIQVKNVGLDPQPNSTSRAVGALLGPKCLHETHRNPRVGEEPGMRSVLSWWPGGTKARTYSKRELCQLPQSG